MLFLYAHQSVFIHFSTATDILSEDEQLSEKVVSVKTIDVKSANYPPSASTIPEIYVPSHEGDEVLGYSISNLSL